MIRRLLAVLVMCLVASCTSYERFQEALQNRGQASCVCFSGNAMSYVQVKGYAIRGLGDCLDIPDEEILRACLEASKKMLDECKDFC